MKLTALILFVLVGLATTMSIYEALYPEDTFEDVLRSQFAIPILPPLFTKIYFSQIIS